MLHGLDQEISSRRTVTERLVAVEQLVGHATATYSLLAQAGIPFQAETGPRNLEVWQRAVRTFRSEVGQ